MLRMGPQLLDNLRVLLLGSTDDLCLQVGGVEMRLSPGLLEVFDLGLYTSQLPSLGFTSFFTVVLLGNARTPANLAT